MYNNAWPVSQSQLRGRYYHSPKHLMCFNLPIVESRLTYLAVGLPSDSKPHACTRLASRGPSLFTRLGPPFAVAGHSPPFSGHPLIPRHHPAPDVEAHLTKIPLQQKTHIQTVAYPSDALDD